MSQRTFPKPTALSAGLTSAFTLLALAVAGCDGGSGTPGAPTSVADTSIAADAARATELEARARELEQREQSMAAKEQQESVRQQAAADTAEQERLATEKAAASRKAAAAKSAAANKTTPRLATAQPAAVAPVHVPTSVQVPAGTALTVSLATDLTTKTANPGDAFESRLVSDLMVDGYRVATAGARVTGTVTQVISGSKAIGAIPTLALNLNHLELSDGQQTPITAEYSQQGQSEKGRDTAKILTGGTIGAVVGHKVKSGKGTVIGGLLGGAAGAVVAKNTGTELELPAGSNVTILLGQGFSVAGT
ncbi:MAG: glycine zipper 2TM domain-containing protein [Gammaproteobacteria bacterium]